jgi:hypothetical protein
VIAAIVAAEVAFWTLLLGGLTLRYLLRARRASTIVLAFVPLVDLAFVVLAAIIVASGAEPERSHSFAAIYFGVTVVFGPSLTRRVDVWFKHRFAGGPKPVKPPKGSRAEVRAIWHEWFRVVATAALVALTLLGMIALAGWSIPASLNDASTHPYWATLLLLPIVTVAWFLAGPAFAGRGNPELDQTPDNKWATTAQTTSKGQSVTRSTEPNHWAPWWLYLVVILPLNWARAAALPMADLPEPMVAAIAVAQAAILFLVITVIWRRSQRDRRSSE